MLKQVSWRGSNRALFLFSLLLVPMYLFSADSGGAAAAAAGTGGSPFDPASIWPQGFSGHETRATGEFYSQVPTLSARMVEACTRNMPPLLCGFLAYQKSPSSMDPRRQIVSFNRLLLVGPPGTGKSETVLAVAQKLGYKIRLVKSTSLRGRNRGETALNIEALFKELRGEQARTFLIIDELHQLFEGYENHHTDHKESAVAFWQCLDDFEINKPNIIIVGTANRANLLPQELKSRFRVQYVYIGEQSESEWEAGLEDVYDDDSDVEGGLDMESLLGIKGERRDATKKSASADSSASAAAGGKAERDDESDDDEPFDPRFC